MYVRYHLKKTVPRPPTLNVLLLYFPLAVQVILLSFEGDDFEASKYRGVGERRAFWFARVPSVDCMGADSIKEDARIVYTAVQTDGTWGQGIDVAWRCRTQSQCTPLRCTTHGYLVATAAANSSSASIFRCSWETRHTLINHERLPLTNLKVFEDCRPS